MKKMILAALCAAALSGLACAAEFLQEGIASWYGAEFEGKPTASGEVFSAYAYTAAHPTLPFGTMLRVTSRHNNKSVVVRVNDRGPFVAARIIDLSRAAAADLDMIKTGTAPVTIEAISPEAAAAETRSSSAALFAVPQAETLPPAAKPPEAAPAEVAAVPPAAEPVPALSPTACTLKGAVPANSAKLYRIQVGAYLQPRHAVEAFEKLKKAGLLPAYEKHNEFYRVVLAGVKTAEVPALAEKLGAAGFREAIVREES